VRRVSAVSRAVVRNRAKLAYNSIAAWLDGVAPAPGPLAAVAGLVPSIASAQKVVVRYGYLPVPTMPMRSLVSLAMRWVL
jgi:hypothetical protein